MDRKTNDSKSVCELLEMKRKSILIYLLLFSFSICENRKKSIQRKSESWWKHKSSIGNSVECWLQRNYILSVSQFFISSLLKTHKSIIDFLFFVFLCSSYLIFFPLFGFFCAKDLKDYSRLILKWNEIEKFNFRNTFP